MLTLDPKLIYYRWQMSIYNSPDRRPRIDKAYLYVLISSDRATRISRIIGFRDINEDDEEDILYTTAPSFRILSPACGRNGWVVRKKDIMPEERHSFTKMDGSRSRGYARAGTMRTLDMQEYAWGLRTHLEETRNGPEWRGNKSDLFIRELLEELEREGPAKHTAELECPDIWLATTSRKLFRDQFRLRSTKEILPWLRNLKAYDDRMSLRENAENAMDEIETEVGRNREKDLMRYAYPYRYMTGPTRFFGVPLGDLRVIGNSWKTADMPRNRQVRQSRPDLRLQLNF